MEWLSFDLTPVKAAEMKLNQWSNDLDPLQQLESRPHLSGVEAELQFHEWEDRYHCAEAWRCTLLLFIESTFKRGSARRPFAVARLVRKTIDHIRCCRRTSQTQKQLLLPAFLAGSETSDEDMRDFVRGFCSYWADKCRYSMFSSVPLLLDEIWNTGKWWGAVIDSKTRSRASDSGKNSMQILLG